MKASGILWILAIIIVAFLVLTQCRSRNEVISGDESVPTASKLTETGYYINGVKVRAMEWPPDATAFSRPSVMFDYGDNQSRIADVGTEFELVINPSTISVLVDPDCNFPRYPPSGKDISGEFPRPMHLLYMGEETRGGAKVAVYKGSIFESGLFLLPELTLPNTNCGPSYIAVRMR